MKAELHGQIPAPEAVLTVLGATSGARLIDHDCRKPKGDRGSYEYAADYGVVLVRRGGYHRDVNGRGAYLGPTDAFFERPFVEQRIDHYLEGGDRSTSIWLTEEAVCALAGDASLPDDAFTTTPAVDLEHHELVAALRRGIDRFELDERLSRFVAALAELAAPGRFTARRAATRRNHDRLVQQAREAIQADPAFVDLGTLAATLGHSRFHISRVFSRSTGMTLAQFRNRVRVAMALEQLADGPSNLAMVSADLGFVDQSHLSRAVHASMGVRLSTVRRRLGDRG